MTRADSYERTGELFCVCGTRIGTPGHKRMTCLTWLHEPAPGHGHPLPWSIPWRLYDRHLQGMSHEHEAYLTFWLGRYRGLMAALDRYNSDYYQTYLATMHPPYWTIAETAEEFRQLPGTVRVWKHRAIAFVRGREDDWRAWEDEPRGGLDLTESWREMDDEQTRDWLSKNERPARDREAA